MLFCYAYVLENDAFGDDNTNHQQTCTCIRNVLACIVWMDIVFNIQGESLIDYVR